MTATGSPCNWYEGDPDFDVPDDYNGPCIHCQQPRDAHDPGAGQGLTDTTSQPSDRAT